jgi:hypothetical protein
MSTVKTKMVTIATSLIQTGWTALHYAVDSQSNNSEILKLLLKQPNARVDIPNADNNLPIHYFSKRSFFDQGSFLLSVTCLYQLDVFSQLINKATNRLSVLNAQNKNGET